MKETTKAYIAGLIDAEGDYSIGRSVVKNRYVSFDPLIRFTTTYKPVVKWAIQNFGGVYKPYDWNNGLWKQYYCWKFSSDMHAARFLRLILPYIWIKRAEANLLLEYYSLNGQQNKMKREELHARMVEIKQQRESLTPNMPSFPKKTVHAYFAGIFDGEGSAFILKYKYDDTAFHYRSCVSASNTFKPLVLCFEKIYNGFWRERPPHNGILPMYEWNLTRQKEQEQFILALLPYVKIKREQMKLLLNFIRMRGQRNPAERDALYIKVRQLNGKKIESELHGDVQSDTAVTQPS